MDEHYKFSFADLAESFSIFAKYERGTYKTESHGDNIEVRLDSLVVLSPEDKERIAALGWHQIDGYPMTYFLDLPNMLYTLSNR